MSSTVSERTPLPGILAEIEEIAGRDAAIALALKLGGESVHVPRPRNMSNGHPLVEIFGAAAATVSERYAGECLYIPKARRALVRHLAASGLGVREIARMLGITAPTVRQYRRGR